MRRLPRDKTTRGQLSKQTIKSAALNPKARQLGFSFEAFDIGSDLPEVAFGNFIGRVTGSLIEIDGQNIIAVLPPESLGGPFRINAMFTDDDGNCILRIDENQWMGSRYQLGCGSSRSAYCHPQGDW